SRLAPSADVFTFHNDIAGTGVNANESQLTPANVRAGSFVRLSTTPVDGNVYAQPLVAGGINIAAGPNSRPGAAGVHDIALVATEHDSVYAIDTSNGAVLWQRTFLDTSNPSNNTLGATAIMAVPLADTASSDISPEVGITGTPVIDPATGLLYVIAKTKET